MYQDVLTIDQIGQYQDAFKYNFEDKTIDEITMSCSESLPILMEAALRPRLVQS